MRPTFHLLRVRDVRQETADCVSVAFDVPEELRKAYTFKAGQYLTLRTELGGEDVRRSYSICSGTGDGELRVAIKKVERGVFSTWVNESLQPGNELRVMTPMGNFSPDLSSGTGKVYLLVAAGSGITPVVSIARTILQSDPESEVTLLYGNRYFNRIIFRDLLEDMKDTYLGRFRVFHVLSGEPNDIPLFHGRIDGDKLSAYCRTFIDLKRVDEMFICGPEPMIRAVREFAIENGLDPSCVYVELFATPGSVPEQIRPPAKREELSTGTTCQVSIIYDGLQTDFTMPADGTVILDAARRQGLDIPFSCQGGMCCTCRAHLNTGEVKMRVNYALEPGEVDAGFILTCQSEPKSDRVIVDFDKV